MNFNLNELPLSFPIEKLDSLQKLIHINTDVRGLGDLPAGNDFSQAGKDLWNAKRVIIMTGFLIASHMVGETDGPPGTISLAWALDQLGKDVCLVTDKYSSEALSKCLDLFNWHKKPRIINLEKGNEEIVCHNLLTQFVPDHIVAIERPGQNIEGLYHNMAGNEFSKLLPDSDLLMHLARQNNIRNTAIGDGGNEVGMGKIADYIALHVPHGEKICAVFAADNLIVAGISNWGGAALAAYLSLQAGKQLLYSKEREKEILLLIVSAGLIDGAIKKMGPTVDGLSTEDYLNVFQQIRDISQIE